MEYEVIEASGLIRLVQKVQEYFDKGWKATGGIATSEQNGCTQCYLQAIVREKKI